MRSAIILAAGLVLLLVFVLAARLASGGDRSRMAQAALAFLPVWLAATVYNLWIGVSEAGYTVAQEAPILALLFAPPAAAALAVWRKFSRHR